MAQIFNAMMRRTVGGRELGMQYVEANKQVLLDALLHGCVRPPALHALCSDDGCCFDGQSRLRVGGDTDPSGQVVARSVWAVRFKPECGLHTRPGHSEGSATQRVPLSPVLRRPLGRQLRKACAPCCLPTLVCPYTARPCQFRACLAAPRHGSALCADVTHGVLRLVRPEHIRVVHRCNKSVGLDSDYFECSDYSPGGVACRYKNLEISLITGSMLRETMKQESLARRPKP